MPCQGLRLLHAADPSFAVRARDTTLGARLPAPALAAPCFPGYHKIGPASAAWPAQRRRTGPAAVPKAAPALGTARPDKRTLRAGACGANLSGHPAGCGPAWRAQLGARQGLRGCHALQPAPPAAASTVSPRFGSLWRTREVRQCQAPPLNARAGLCHGRPSLRPIVIAELGWRRSPQPRLASSGMPWFGCYLALACTGRPALGMARCKALWVPYRALRLR